MTSFDHRKYRPTPAVPMSQRQWPNRRIERAPLWASADLRDGHSQESLSSILGQHDRRTSVFSNL